VDLRAHAQRHGGVDLAHEALQARQAVAGGQVRRALRQRVDHREVGAAVHGAGREPQRRRAGRPLHGLDEQLADEADDAAGVVAGDDVDVPALKGLLLVRGAEGGEGVVVAGVEDGAVDEVRVVPVALQLRRRLTEYPREGAGHAFGAGGVVDDVAAAERHGVDDVGSLADSGGGEVHRGGGGVLGEGVRDNLHVVTEDVGGRRERCHQHGEDQEEDDHLHDDCHLRRLNSH